MIDTIYRDLAEFGLRLIAPGEPGFNRTVDELRRCPPFGFAIDDASDRTAVLENQSQSAVITLGYVCRYVTTKGETRTRRYRNLGSSRQMDVLTGKQKADWDLSSFILPGTRRLLTERGMFGDNRDVLGPPPATGGWLGGGFGRAGGLGNDNNVSDFERDLARIELDLEVAIFEDGLCVGPDEAGLRESLTEQMQKQSETAREIVGLLRDGATLGRVFDVLCPLARHLIPQPQRRSSSASDTAGPGSEGFRGHILLTMFARSAIQRMMDGGDTNLLSWFEEAADISPLRLHRRS